MKAREIVTSLRAVGPHALRSLAMALGGLALAFCITGNAGLASTALGAVAGVLLGHRLGVSRLRLPAILVTALIGALVAWLLPSIATSTVLLPRLIGGPSTLLFAVVVRFGLSALALTASMRAVAVRKPSAVAAELLVVGFSITAVFSSHREGYISRPLWLSDWALHRGIDPSTVLLAIGFAAVGLLGALLLVESKSGRGLSALAMLVALGWITMLGISVVGPPKPHPQPDVDTHREMGDPPILEPPDDGGGESSTRGGQDGAASDSSSDGGGRSSEGDASQGSDGGSRKDAEGDGSADAGDSPQQVPPQPPMPSPPRLSEDPSGSPSPAPVAVVLLEDDYSPPSQGYYFRQEALSQFNGSRMVPTGRPDADRDGVIGFPTEPTRVEEPPAAPGRTLVHTTVVLITQHANPFALESATKLSPAANPDLTRFVRAYKTESLSQSIDFKKLLGRKAGNKKWSPELLAYYTRAPTDPRYAEMANKMLEKLPPARQSDPFARAVAVKTQLDAALTYSSKQKHEGAGDPTAGFLFGNKIGYCVHFAHAAVYLWRTLGVPARIGVGYRTDEDDRHGGSTIVIQSNKAHAWPELYLEGVGWIVLDIVAAKNLDPPATPPDQDLQRTLGDLARKLPPDPGKRDPPPPGAYGREVAMTGLLVIAAAIVLLYLVKLWRRARPSFSGVRSLPRTAYRAGLDVVAELGFTRDHGETREAFARRVQKIVPGFERLTYLHSAARLRDPALGAGEEASPPAYRAALAAVKKEAWSVGVMRRLLGLLNPVSIFNAR